ncbi:MAG: cob(I)yrinic acid a,c-diamide adenosyltransferase [Anaerolineae bacterium]|nr:MAG: cob(I)yrinic acid a,c-diamide adenosyltransferase [Anaerolineae bacterium]
MMSRISTGTGDEGMTSLGTLSRLSKDSERVDAYGEIDELNSLIGAAISVGLEPEINDQLKRIQGELFHLGTVLAYPDIEDRKDPLPRIKKQHIDQLEGSIDEMSEIVGPLRKFILPGGSSGASALHVARAACRRAERAIVSLNLIEPVDVKIIIYINRLSDALFLMARFENLKKGVAETLWEPTPD